MVVLVIGARGFIGRHLSRALEHAGHRVVPGARPDFDLASNHDASDWRERLRGMDVVVNAAGIIRERGGQTFEAIHANGPIALFAACAEAGVAVVQISALGADEEARSPFHRSKRAADEALLALDVPSIVLQPSLVFGHGGASARLFAVLASLPLVPLPGRGDQQIQPVHVEDLAQAVVTTVRDGIFPRTRLPVVGAQAMSLRAFLATLRLALGLGHARFLPIPEALVTLSARAGLGLLDLDTWRMLRRGNTADPSAMRRLLGRAPRAPAEFVDVELRQPLRTQAKLAWLLPLLRVAIAVVWVTAGVVSAGLYPVGDSLALLARAGIGGAAAYAALYGAALLDFGLGVATLAIRRRRWLWVVQLAVIVGYTAIITVFLPEQWLHPYGPVVKNLPLLAAIWLLLELEER